MNAEQIMALADLYRDLRVGQGTAKARAILQSAVEELVRDAERYQWLRNNANAISWTPSRYNTEIVSGFAAFGTGYLGYGFEDAIDKAMKDQP